MDSAIKKLWTDALRGGDYKQTRNMLNRPNVGHCCMGVLCELAVIAGVVESVLEPGDTSTGYRSAPTSTDDDQPAEHDTLPRAVVKWAGLGSHDPCVAINSEFYSLSRHNDGGRLKPWEVLRKGRSFAEIADAIERDL